MISEAQLVRGTDYVTYKEHFARRFAQLLLEHDAQPFVVQSVGAEFLRRYFVPYDTIVTVHLFKDPAHLAEVMRDRKHLSVTVVEATTEHRPVHDNMQSHTHTAERERALKHCLLWTSKGSSNVYFMVHNYNFIFIAVLHLYQYVSILVCRCLRLYSCLLSLSLDAVRGLLSFLSSALD